MTDIEKTIKGLTHCIAWNGLHECQPKVGDDCPYEDEADCKLSLMRDVLTLLKKQQPKTPIHIHEEYPEHDWQTDEDGKIDEWAMEYDFHNGPACKRCGYSFCKHCEPNGWNKQPCVIDYYQCPGCGIRILKNGGKTRYCDRCGQEVKWE